MSSMSMSALLSALRGAGRQHLTASTAAARQAVTGSHVFRIQGYTQVRKTVPAGTAINSTKFHVGGHDWRILCYPNGDSQEIDDGKFMSLFSTKNKYMSLFLENLGGRGSATGEFELSVLDRAGMPSCTQSSKLPLFKGGLGWKEFVKNNKLDLVDDCLTVLCDVTVNPVPEPTAAVEAAKSAV